MNETTFVMESKADGLPLSVMTVVPEGEIRAIVQIVHGMCEYKERYLDFMRFLASNGYACIIHDHRGHGQSVKQKEDLGYFYEGGYQGLKEDIHQVMLKMKADYSEEKLPYYLIGHSMGSLAVRCFVKKYDAEIDKLLVIGCPSKLPGMGLGLVLIKILEKLKGGKKHSKLLDNIVINSNYEKRYADENIVHAWVNSDRKAVEAYNADPYCNYTFTINGYRNLVSLTKETYSKGGYVMQNPNLLIRFLSGEGDPCAISKKDIGKAMNYMKKAGYKNVRAKLYKNMRHEILNEPEHAKVYQDILDIFAL